MSNTADIIHAKIYDAIVEQRLPPGTKLGEKSLCEIFGVSRTLIRRVCSASPMSTWWSRGPTAAPALPARQSRRRANERPGVLGSAVPDCGEEVAQT